VSLATALCVDEALADISGAISFDDGRVRLATARTTPAGTFGFDGTVGLDLALSGRMIFEASAATRAKLMAQSEYARLLFDEAGGLKLAMDLGGTVEAPTVALQLAPLEQRFTREAQRLVEAEVGKAARLQLAKLQGGAKDAALEQVKAKLGEEAAAKISGEGAAKELEKAKQKLKSLFGK
jgi:hypothetical protein